MTKHTKSEAKNQCKSKFNWLRHTVFPIKMSWDFKYKAFVDVASTNLIRVLEKIQSNSSCLAFRYAHMWGRLVLDTQSNMLSLKSADSVSKDAALA